MNFLSHEMTLNYTQRTGHTPRKRWIRTRRMYSSSKWHRFDMVGSSSCATFVAFKWDFRLSSFGRTSPDETAFYVRFSPSMLRRVMPTWHSIFSITTTQISECFRPSHPFYNTRKSANKMRNAECKGITINLVPPNEPNEPNLNTQIHQTHQQTEISISPGGIGRSGCGGAVGKHACIHNNNNK